MQRKFFLPVLYVPFCSLRDIVRSTLVSDDHTTRLSKLDHFLAC